MWGAEGKGGGDTEQRGVSQRLVPSTPSFGMAAPCARCWAAWGGIWGSLLCPPPGLGTPCVSGGDRDRAWGRWWQLGCRQRGLLEGQPWWGLASGGLPKMNPPPLPPNPHIGGGGEGRGGERAAAILPLLRPYLFNAIYLIAELP